MITLKSDTLSRKFRKVCSVVVLGVFFVSSIIPPSTVFAQSSSQRILNLPDPGTLVPVSSVFSPTLIRGITVYPNNPLQFDFIMDRGDANLESEALEAESKKLIKYFMASLTVPEEEMWVNLSPYEKGRIIPDGFAQTEMGRDLLAQDYILKQLTASLMHPEEELGAEFWKRVHAKAQELYGHTDIPMDTFNKIWIVPGKATIYHKDKSAFILESRLKVMLEDDYSNLYTETGKTPVGLGQAVASGAKSLHSVSTDIVREVLLPEIEKEVNEGKQFAALRQIYNAMLLATWYKINLKESLLGEVYVDQNKTKGIALDDTNVHQDIYEQYLDAFKKGVYNAIKEDYDPVTQKVIPRRYFSGGADLRDAGQVIENIEDSDSLDFAMAGRIQPLLQEAYAKEYFTAEAAFVNFGNRDLSIVLDTDVGTDDLAMLSGPKLMKLLGLKSWTNQDEAEVMAVLQLVDNVNYLVQHLEEGSAILSDDFVEQLRRPGTWVDQNTPAVNNFTVASMQFEQGLDRGLIEKILTTYGDEVARYIGQLNMTGGLGALMHDLTVGWHKNGADVIPINVIYNDEIKGDVRSQVSLPKSLNSMGDVVRGMLEKTDITYSLELQSEEFARNADNNQARDVIGRTITVEVYEGQSKFGDLPLEYIDAYYEDEQGNRRYIFDVLYPDNDWRDVQMAVYSLASQRLLKILQERGRIKKNILFIGNEVFASLPLNEFDDEENLRQHINHTIWKPGMYQPKWYSYGLLGFDDRYRSELIENGKIKIGEYAAAKSDFVTGVGLYEHTPVLRGSVFSQYRNRIWELDEDGLRNTNGALFDMWQGTYVRTLIDRFKQKFEMDAESDDRDFFAKLDEVDGKLKNQFLDSFEFTKSFYALELLVFLSRSQTRATSGGGWLREILEQIDVEFDSVDSMVSEYGSLVQDVLDEKEGALSLLEEKFGGIKETLQQIPILTNIRRQVPYKGPDKYMEWLLELKGNPDLLEEFRNSNTRLIIGGRTFEIKARRLFEDLRALATELGLSDRIAFVSEYSISDAPIIARGAAGSVMLSDEFLEASSTFMMKTMANGGSLIGVWGGAVPEILDIWDTEKEQQVDVLKTKITHDQLVVGLKSGQYVIRNGWLIDYDDTPSGEEGGGRRPAVKGLHKGFVKVGNAHTKRQSRRDRLFANLANMHRVDIVRSQARAHIKLWEAAYQRRQALQNIIDTFQGDDVATKELSNALDREVPFTWVREKWGVDRQELLEGNGLRMFLEHFRVLRARGDNELIDSLRFHQVREGLTNGGDILTFLKTTFEGKDLKPIQALIEQAETGIKAIRAGELDQYMSQDDGDDAMAAATLSTTQVDKAEAKDKRVGGIDLNAELVDIQFERGENGIPVPLFQKPIGELQIEGFLPVIINVSPLNNLQLLLGSVDNARESG